MFLFDNMVRYGEGKVSLSKKGQLQLISHGHFDHLPSSFKGAVICSDITRKMIKIRMNKDVICQENCNVQMLDSGHTLGSKMFYLKDEGLLYTGDFNTVRKHWGCAKPRRCSTLIVECTYGVEKYAFPKYNDVVNEFIDYCRDNVQVTIKAYSFGKAQEICHLLNQHKVPFSVKDPSIQKINKGLGLDFGYEDDNAGILLTGEKLPSHKSVALSGWAVDSGFKYWNRSDASFVLSDHADYPSLVSFVKKCNPERIYTYHGFAVEFAHSLRKAGFDARPLLKNQSLLNDFMQKGN